MPGWARREPYTAYFARLAAAADAGAAFRRLIPHLDAELNGDERAALWRSLWACSRRLPDVERLTLALCLDGRHARRLAPLATLDWADPALWLHLYRDGAGDEAARAALLRAVLDAAGVEPLAAAAGMPPALVIATAAAELTLAAARLTGERIGQLQAAVLQAAEADAEELPAAMALLFELALHARDEDTATAVLAELIRHGHAGQVRAERVAAWLDGSAGSDDPDTALPLQLAPALQRQWLRPADWARPGVLLQLAATLQRPAPRARLLALAALLPETAGALAPAPLGQGLQVLAALDAAYALAETRAETGAAIDAAIGTQTGTRIAAQIDTLAAPGLLAPAALAALHRAEARRCAATADREGELLALVQARRLQADPALRARLARLLPAPTPAFSADWREEEAWWLRLAQRGRDGLQRVAAFQLATLWTEGHLEPRPPRRCAQRPDEAQAMWSWLAGNARYEPLAQRALQDPVQTLMRPALSREGGLTHLWFECPGAQAVTIVFSCIASHHGFAEVAALRHRLRGQHLLFVRCPEKNWYCDETYEAVHALLRQRVAARFAPADVTCWYGSMGGHAALKFALTFGWRAIVFNPQTDLDLWAAFRPRERSLLWGAERHAVLGDGAAAPWQQVPLYYACGASTADREALSWVIDRLRRCSHLSAVIEKFDDADHAGLMGRISGGAVRQAALLQRIGQRLTALAGADALPGMQPLDGAAAVAAFWDRLDAARALKVEVQLREGRLWWQPSLACATR